MNAACLKTNLLKLVGVEAVEIEENRFPVEHNGIDPHSIRVTITGGDDREICEELAKVPPYIRLSGEFSMTVDYWGVYRRVQFSRGRKTE